MIVYVVTHRNTVEFVADTLAGALATLHRYRPSSARIRTASDVSWVSEDGYTSIDQVEMVMSS